MCIEASLGRHDDDIESWLRNMTKSYASLAEEEERVVEAAARSKLLFVCVCFFFLSSCRDGTIVDKSMVGQQQHPIDSLCHPAHKSKNIGRRHIGLLPSFRPITIYIILPILITVLRSLPLCSAY